MGADIIRRALPYALKLIARNAGVNGSVVVQKVGASKILAATCCLRLQPHHRIRPPCISGSRLDVHVVSF